MLVEKERVCEDVGIAPVSRIIINLEDESDDEDEDVESGVLPPNVVLEDFVVNVNKENTAPEC